MSPTPILRVDSLCKGFRSVQAVNDVSFSINRGDIFAFLGPNGAGKTTTLRILLDIIRADSGSIQWNLNGTSSSLPEASQIGYLPEERGLYTDLPLIRSLVYLASIRGMDPSQAKAEAMEWLERLELADRANEKLQNLSKGNQQKVQFVASILHKPTFAILDEPFSGLDPLNQEMFLGYIRELNEQGTTILLSAHQMALVERIASRVFLINRGQEVFNGYISEILRRYGQARTLNIRFEPEFTLEKLNALNTLGSIAADGTKEVSVTVNPDVDFQQVLTILSGIEGVADVKSHSVTLHDVFLNLVNQD